VAGGGGGGKGVGVVVGRRAGQERQQPSPVLQLGRDGDFLDDSLASIISIIPSIVPFLAGR
jgi:hypothetical protein